MLAVPNLDAMSRDDLIALRAALLQLAEYANYKAGAIPERAAGDIAEAQRYERAAERVYSMLPTWARW